MPILNENLQQSNKVIAPTTDTNAGHINTEDQEATDSEDNISENENN